MYAVIYLSCDYRYLITARVLSENEHDSFSGLRSQVTSERTPPSPQPDRLVLDLPTI